MAFTAAFRYAAPLYIEVVTPLITPEELRATTQAVHDFEAGLGPSLHRERKGRNSALETS